MMEWIISLLAGYPQFSAVFAIMGILRLVFKPLCSLISTYVLATPSDTDNKWWADVQASKFWGSLIYLIDLFGSVKLPVGKP